LFEDRHEGEIEFSDKDALALHGFFVAAHANDLVHNVRFHALALGRRQNLPSNDDNNKE
jgi:hypothetical protein